MSLFEYLINAKKYERDWRVARDRLNDLLTFDQNHPRDPISGRFVDAPNDLLDVVNIVCAHVPRQSIPAAMYSPPESPPDRR